MRLDFCTLFDSGYLLRGLALYESLIRHCNDFHLYIIAFDDRCFRVLKELHLDKATIIPLAEFENDDLLSVKEERTRGEYCWTCASSSILYLIETYNLECCTYLDADLYFFSSPLVLIDEMGENSVLITEHRYSKQYKVAEDNGKYCVQFMTFKNDSKGLKVLRKWCKQCIQWCYGRLEDGKFGDQKYLDNWPAEYEGIHVLKHLGGGVAPWNIQQYQLYEKSGNLLGVHKSTQQQFNVIFYHFHDLKFIDGNRVQLTGGYFQLDRYLIDTLYKKYLFHLNDLRNKLSIFDESFLTIDIADIDNQILDFFSKTFIKIRNIIFKKSGQGSPSIQIGFLDSLRNVFFMLKHNYNIISNSFDEQS